MYRKRKTDYFPRLAAQGKKVFHSSELALLWGISNKNTLHTTFSRYQKRGLLYRLAVGIYSILPAEKLSPFEIGCAVAGPLSYVSTETVLFKEGLIDQSINCITLMGKKEKELIISGQRYLCRRLDGRHLVNRIGIMDKIGYAIATPIRAIADLKHINPMYHLDSRTKAIENDLININTQLGYR